MLKKTGWLSAGLTLAAFSAVASFAPVGVGSAAMFRSIDGIAVRAARLAACLGLPALLVPYAPQLLHA